MRPVWEDPRVAAAMPGLLAQLRDAERDRARRLGWKLGLGAPPALEAAQIGAPLVGFLTDRTRAPAGSEWPLDGYAKAMLEPEIAVHLGRDVDPEAGAEQAADAIDGLGAAIEIADVDRGLDDVEGVLGGNIFHRAVALGPPLHDWRGVDLTAQAVRIVRDGEEVAGTDDPQGAVGAMPDLVAHTARYLAAFGERLRAGDVLITGSLVPAIPVAPGQHVEVRTTDLGTVSLAFA